MAAEKAGSKRGQFLIMLLMLLVLFLGIIGFFIDPTIGAAIILLDVLIRVIDSRLVKR